jgi:SNF2 family DNA or RNA helicase
LFHFLRARPLDRWELFNERIVKPMKRNQTKLAMKRLHAVLPAIMLRRTKDAEIGAFD